MSVAQRVRISSMVLLRRRDWAGGAGPAVDARNGAEPGAVVVVVGCEPEVVVVEPSAENGVSPGAAGGAAG
jgi:hypothetical protein